MTGYHLTDFRGDTAPDSTSFCHKVPGSDRSENHAALVNRLAKQTTRGMVKTTSGCNAKLVKFDSLLSKGDGPILYQQNNLEKHQ